MLYSQTTPPGLARFEEVGGGLSVRLSNGSMTIFDENGQELIAADSSIRKSSSPRSESDAAGPDADPWNPWRQGP